MRLMKEITASEFGRGNFGINTVEVLAWEHEKIATKYRKEKAPNDSQNDALYYALITLACYQIDLATETNAQTPLTDIQGSLEERINQWTDAILNVNEGDWSLLADTIRQEGEEFIAVSGPTDPESSVWGKALVNLANSL